MSRIINPNAVRLNIDYDLKTGQIQFTPEKDIAIPLVVMCLSQLITQLVRDGMTQAQQLAQPGPAGNGPRSSPPETFKKGN